MYFSRIFVAALLFAFSTAIQPICSSRETIYSFKLGRWNASVIEDGVLLGIENFFNVPPFIVLRSFHRYYPNERLESSHNMLLLRDSDNVILVDTGSGENLLDGLRTLGVAPNEVTAILLTHLHSDHTGSLVGKSGKSVFPNAIVYMHRIEHEFWSLPAMEISRRFPNIPFELGIGPSVTIFELVKHAYTGRIRLLNNHESPIRGITAVLREGHSLGHVAYSVKSDGKKLMVVGDAIPGRTTLVQHPHWFFIGDTNVTRAVRTRYELMNKLAGDNTLILSYHERFPGLGFIVRDGVSFDFLSATSK